MHIRAINAYVHTYYISTEGGLSAKAGFQVALLLCYSDKYL